ncbi:MAG: YtxH domain-containing protein [Chloroflexota bacterium]|nr:YtxH domain-containing protein [Chloroflexota bacterium]
MTNKNSDIGAFLSGFVLGGLVGSAVALLLAPQTGEETRTYIKDRSIELKDVVEKSAADARVKADATLADARKQTEKFTQQAQAKADELRQQGQVVLDEQKSKLEEVLDAGKKKLHKKDPKVVEEPAEAATSEA